MRDGVFDDKERGDREGPNEPVGRPRNVVLNGFTFSLGGRLLDPVWLGGPSIDQSCETDLHDGAVCKVDCEAVAADPHEDLVREDVLESGGKPDAGHHEIPSNGGVTLGEAGCAFRDEEVSNPFELPGPGCPLPVLAREACDVPADDNEGGEYSSADLWVAVDKVAEVLL